MIERTSDRLEACERELHRLRMIVGIVTVLVGAAAVLMFAGNGPARSEDIQSSSLRLKELVIVDDHGVERARLSGHLPDAIIGGKRVNRGGSAGGLLIYDDTGQERGGYLTFDEPSGNALLTLDTRGGQVAYLAADKREGIALRIWTGGNAVELRADSSGARTTTTHAGRIVLQEPRPSSSEIAAMCAGLKSDLAGLDPKPPMGKVLDACAQRMPESDCRKCLGQR